VSLYKSKDKNNIGRNDKNTGLKQSGDDDSLDVIS